MFALRCGRQSGLTALELLITIACAAVLILFAAPNLASLLEKSRLNTTIEALNTSLRFIRSEALRGTRSASEISTLLLVRIPPNDAQAPQTPSCQNIFSANEWSCGWRVIMDANSNHQFDASDTLLHQYVNTAPRIGIIHKGAGASYMSVRANGTLPFAHSFGIAVRNSNDENLYGDALCISTGGRIRRVHDNDSTNPC